MNHVPQSRFYEFERMLTENNLTQSWIATNTSTLSRCFVKTLSSNESLNRSDKAHILNLSFDSQRNLLSHNLVRAVTKHSENGTIFYEYPYLDGSEWEPLNPSTFLRRFDLIFPEMCLILDYIHIMGLIHADVKLSNFLISKDPSKTDVCLADLDLLRPEKEPLRNKLLGTMQYIPPEVETNDDIFPTSDNFSLGLCLQEILSDCRNGEHDKSRRSRLSDLSDKLTESDHHNRPPVLLDAAHECGLIDDAMLRAFDKRLLTLQLLSSYRAVRKSGTRDINVQRFFAENKVLGLYSEFLEDFETIYRQHRLPAFRIMRNLLKDSEINRYVDYWHVSMSPALLTSAYSGLNKLSGGKPLLPMSIEPASAEEFEKQITTSAFLRKRGRHLKAYLCLWNVNRKLERFPVTISNKLQIDLYGGIADLAVILGTDDDAAVRYGEAADFCGQSSQQRFEYLRRAVYQYLFRGDFESAEKLIEFGSAESGALKHRSISLEFKRLGTWIMAAKGELDYAEAEIEKLMSQARETQDHLLEMRTYSDRGTLLWRRGDYSNALKHYELGAKVAAENGLMKLSYATLSNVSLLCAETLDYRSSIKFAKLAKKYVIHPIDYARLPSLYRTLTVSHTRMAEYGKSEHWRQRFLDAGGQKNSKAHLARYLSDCGWMRLQKGELSMAHMDLTKSAILFKQIQSKRELGKVYQNLAELAFYRSNGPLFDHYFEKAIEIFTAVGDKASEHDVLLFKALFELLYLENQDAASEIGSISEQQVKLGSYYSATLGLCHALLSDKAASLIDFDTFQPLIEQVESSKAPVCKTLKALIEFRRVVGDDPAHGLKLLKSAYTLVNDAGNSMLAALISHKIMEYYIHSGSVKMACNYLSNAYRLADNLKNEVLKNRYWEELKDFGEERADKRDLLNAIHSISDVFKDLSDYDGTLRKIVEFAAELTGADRGALLFRLHDITDIHVRAYFNCDYDSLSDIVDFSRNVVTTVAETETALVVENALQDRRTKNYKSIAANNIRSVVCIPVYDGKRALGVLYLDHHTIPALFTDEDVRLISSMANFLSHAITTAKNFKNANVLSAEYLRELQASGLKQPFLTESERGNALLSTLRVAATSDISILLTGPSGTGKEILCEMVHAWSNRRDQPLVKVNCSTLAIEGQTEAELFGIVKKTASNVDSRDGRFLAADGGTLFFDEIGDMALEVQAKVLRAIENQEFSPVGSNRVIRTSIRFVFATNKDLQAMVQNGEFREDLYYRIAKLTAIVPSLRERPDDVVMLLNHYNGVFSSARSRPKLRFSPAVVSAMIHYDWPGNVRELTNIVERLCILSTKNTVDLEDLPPEVRKIASGKEAKELTAEIEKSRIVACLKANNWNRRATARAMNMPESTLRNKMRYYGIEGP